MARPDFPATFAAFRQRFASEDDCWHYLVESRCPAGFRCPRCGGGEAWALVKRNLFECRSCRHQTSVTAGTVLHRTGLPLSLWFAAAYLLTTHTPGFSALQLQRQPGLGRYETAFVMLQKLRRAMRRPERDRMRIIVEVDEAYVGGVDRQQRGGRQRDSNKSILVGAVERRENGSGRIRLAVIGNLSGRTLSDFVTAAVEPGSRLLTDGWQGYVPLRDRYDHRPVTVGPVVQRATNASQLLPQIHRTFSNLKTWLKGTHHGVGAKHLPYYVDEFVFRFNRRKTRMAAFQSLLGLTGQHQPSTYKMLYAPELTG